jgi:hypothetical protein
MNEASLIVSASPDNTLTFQCGCCGSEELTVALAVERSSVRGEVIPAIVKLKCFWCDTVHDTSDAMAKSKESERASSEI